MQRPPVTFRFTFSFSDERIRASLAEEAIVREEQRDGSLPSRVVSNAEDQRAGQLHQLHLDRERLEIRGGGDLVEL